MRNHSAPVTGISARATEISRGWATESLGHPRPRSVGGTRNIRPGGLRMTTRQPNTPAVRARSGDPGRAAGAAVLACQSDERLVALCRAGHDAAFEAIVRRYRRPLLAYARRLLDDGRAEDAVQQAFLNAYRAIGSSECELELRPWLYRVAHNATLDVLRRGGLDTVALDDEQDGVERPDEVFERRQRVRDLVAVVQELPERQRDALMLRELEGRGHDEIALQLGVTAGAVRQLIHRARTSVRAGVSAVMPLGLLEPLARGSAGEALAGRLPELVAAGATTTMVAKAGVAIIVVGGMAGGGAAVTRPDAEARAARVAPPAAAHAPASTRSPSAAAAHAPALTSPPSSPADTVRRAKSTRTAEGTTRVRRERQEPGRGRARRSDEPRGAGIGAAAQPQISPAATRPTGTARGVPPREARDRDDDTPEEIEPGDLEDLEDQEEVEEPEPVEPVEIEAPEPAEEDDDDLVEDEIDD